MGILRGWMRRVDSRGPVPADSAKLLPPIDALDIQAVVREAHATAGQPSDDPKAPAAPSWPEGEHRPSYRMLIAAVCLRRGDDPEQVSAQMAIPLPLVQLMSDELDRRGAPAPPLPLDQHDRDIGASGR